MNYGRFLLTTDRARILVSILIELYGNGFIDHDVQSECCMENRSLSFGRHDYLSAVVCVRQRPCVYIGIRANLCATL